MKLLSPLEVLGIPSQILISSFLVTIVLLACGLYSNRIQNKKKYILWTLLIEYVFIVLCSTVLCRDIKPSRVVELMPLWVYIEVYKGTPGVTSLDILLNIVLLFPLGVLLTGLFPTYKIGKVFIVGLSFSLSIEVLQYITYTGVAQLDDLVHNSISCILGWYVSKKVFLNEKNILHL